MTKREYMFVLVAVAWSMVVAGCKDEPKEMAGRLLLLDTRLERTVSKKTEVISRVRFIAQSGASTSVFLPCGDEFGVGISFVPVTKGKGEISLSRAVYTERFFAEDVLGDFAEWSSKHAEASGSWVTELKGKIGEDIIFVRGAKSRNNVDVKYRVIVSCEGMVEFTDMRHVESSLFELNGERLHQLNVAIPQLMSGGVEVCSGTESDVSPDSSVCGEQSIRNLLAFGAKLFDESGKRIQIISYEGKVVGEPTYVFPEPMPKIQGVDLSGSDVTDEALMALEDFPNIKRLTLKRARITDSGLKYIRTLASLEALDLEYTGISEEGLRQIGENTNLQRLNLGGTRVGRLLFLTQFPKISRLNLRNCPLGDEEMDYLRSLLSLTSLDLMKTGVSEAGISKLTGLQSLKELCFKGSGCRLSEESVSLFLKFRGLEKLQLAYSQVDEAGIARIRELSFLTHLYFGGSNLNDKMMMHIHDLPRLRVLGIADTQVSDKGLAYLENLPSLEELGIQSNYEITDAAIDHLKRLKGLRRVQMGNTKITDEGRAELEKALPGARILPY